MQITFKAWWIIFNFKKKCTMR